MDTLVDLRHALADLAREASCLGTALADAEQSPAAAAAVAGHVAELTAAARNLAGRLRERGAWLRRVAAINAGGVEHRSAPPPRRPKARWTAEATPRAAEADCHGGPLLNTAGDPYDPPVLVDGVRLFLEVAAGPTAYALADRYRGAVNSDTFLGVAPGLLRVEDVREDGTARLEYLGGPPALPFAALGLGV